MDGFGDIDKKQSMTAVVLNELADNVIMNGGQVVILEQKEAPDEKSL